MVPKSGLSYLTSDFRNSDNVQGSVEHDSLHSSLQRPRRETRVVLFGLQICNFRFPRGKRFEMSFIFLPFLHVARTSTSGNVTWISVDEIATLGTQPNFWHRASAFG